MFIKTLASYIPKNRLNTEEIAHLASESALTKEILEQKIGLIEKPIADRYDSPAKLGAKAAAKAVEEARERFGLYPEDIAVVIFASASPFDYDMWSPASYVMRELQIKSAYAFEVKNNCNGGNLALSIMKNMLREHPQKHGLVVVGEKLSPYVNYLDKNSLSLFHVADGAAAAVVGPASTARDQSELSAEILSYHALSNGQMVDSLKREQNSAYSFMMIDDPQGLDRILSDIYLTNYQLVVDESLQKANLKRSDIRFLLTNQVKRSLSESILKSLDLSAEQSYPTIAHYGHMGAVDTLFALEQIIREKKVQKGDIVVLASSAAGFTWGSTVIRL